MNCEHVWNHRAAQSGNNVTRYQCARCERWGFRIWHGDRVNEIRAYSTSSTEPDPQWSGRDRALHDYVTARKRDDLESRESRRSSDDAGPITPAYRWKDHL